MTMGHRSSIVHESTLEGMLLAGLIADRPAAGIPGRLYSATDEGILYRDNGSSWIKVGVTDYSDLDDIPASFTPSAHKASHEDGGADEISVAGLSGALADRQDADKLQGRAVQDHIPEDAEVLTWVDGSSQWEPAAAGGGGGVGGLYGINIETLTAGKTLTPNTDEIYQWLQDGNANRIITLDTASATAGDRFVIRHFGSFQYDGYYLEVKQGATSLDYIYATAIKEFIFDGTNWIAARVGTGEPASKDCNVVIGRQARGQNYGIAIGRESRADDHGIAIGYTSRGYTYGAAVGYRAYANSYGVAVGSFADAYYYGVAIGYLADSYCNKYAIAIGQRSKCARSGETSICIDGVNGQKYNSIEGRWRASIAGGAGATEIFCAGQANHRFVVRASSALAFHIQVVARDNVAGHVAFYTFEGVIKRDAAGNTTMSVCNKTVVYEDDATWDCDVTADDANEALIITCTPDGTNPTQFAAVLRGVETHF